MLQDPRSAAVVKFVKGTEADEQQHTKHRLVEVSRDTAPSATHTPYYSLEKGSVPTDQGARAGLIGSMGGIGKAIGTAYHRIGSRLRGDADDFQDAEGGDTTTNDHGDPGGGIRCSICDKPAENLWPKCDSPCCDDCYLKCRDAKS